MPLAKYTPHCLYTLVSIDIRSHGMHVNVDVGQGEVSSKMGELDPPS